MPKGGTKMHTGDGSAIAPEDKALDKMGLYGKPGREDAVRRNKTLNMRRLQQVYKASDEKNGQQTKRP